jgi:heme-degrading monooxygenase HmoA
MLTLRPLDERVPIQQQLSAEASPAILINVFTVAPEDVDGLLAAWEHDANWMKKQSGYISTQLHRGIAGSCTFLNYAVWESVDRFRAAFTHPEFRGARGLSIERRRLATSVREGRGAEFVYALVARTYLKIPG